jgi:uncharacterized BrkB/YihY/UPF0761 family membrane protein
VRTTIVLIALLLFSFLITYLLRAQLKWIKVDARTIRKRTWLFQGGFWLFVFMLFFFHFLYRQQIAGLNEIFIVGVPVAILFVLANKRLRSWFDNKNQ